MILAGGMSTRLYPLTRTVPKPLVPVVGEPISAHVMRWLKSFGYDEIAINIHYLADTIRNRFGDGSAYGVQLKYLYEPKLMGSAGAVKALQDYFREPFVVVGCDCLTDANLESLVTFHRDAKAVATIGLVESDEVDQYGVVITDERSRITDFQEKPPKGTERSKLVNTGIYAFDPQIFDSIPANEFYDFGKQVFPALRSANAEFYGFRLAGSYWADIGTPDEYVRATADALAGRVHLGPTRVSGIAADATVASDVQIDGDVRIGARAQLAAGVHVIGPSVIGDGVTVGEGARLERAIIWDDTTIGARAQLTDTVVGIEYHVPPDADLRDAIVGNEPVVS